MPELPEVEIVKQSLNKKIKLKKVKKVIIRNRNLRFKIPSNFENYLKNRIIKNISRFSKYLILHLSGDSYCIIHLGMSGTIHLIKKNQKKISNMSFYNTPFLPKKHNHVEFHFDHLKLFYNDPRRFGFFVLIKDKIKLEERFAHLGPEPFFQSFNVRYLQRYFENKNKDIKSFLLDQKFVSGIGNIYANEILFFCRINPQKKGRFLSKNDCLNIIYFAKLVLRRAIKKGGSSIRDFKNTSGKSGSFQNEFKVYQREGLKCLKNKCRGKIKKNITLNRSTFFCNICQK